MDNFFGLTKPRANGEYQKKFAEAVFRHWSYLHPRIKDFNELYDNYFKYMKKIPSYGALIFNDKLDEILFNVY